MSLQIKKLINRHLVTACLLSFLASNSVVAGQWYVEPRASLYSFYDDNVGLNVNDSTSSAGFLLGAQVRTGRRTEAFDIGIDSGATRRQFFSASDRNTTDFFFDASTVRRIERDRFELNARLDLDSTLTSEVATTGRLQDNKRRTRWLIAPSWQRNLSERTLLSVDASYRNVAYDDDRRPGVRLVDYTYWTLGGQLTQSLSETTQLIGRMTFDRYDPDLAVSESDIIGFLAGVTHAFTENWTATALVGGRRVEQNTSDTGGLFDFSVRRQFEVGALDLGLSRQISPNGSGELLESTNLSLKWNQPITPRWSWNLVVSAYRNEQSSDVAGSNDRDYYSITPRVRYQLERDWSISGGYRYRYQKYERNTDSADSNTMFVNLIYAPRRERTDLDLTR